MVGRILGVVGSLINFSFVDPRRSYRLASREGSRARDREAAVARKGLTAVCIALARSVLSIKPLRSGIKFKIR